MRQHPRRIGAAIDIVAEQNNQSLISAASEILQYARFGINQLVEATVDVSDCINWIERRMIGKIYPTPWSPYGVDRIFDKNFSQETKGHLDTLASIRLKNRFWTMVISLIRAKAWRFPCEEDAKSRSAPKPDQFA
ncbi:hypothetical protein [Rhizobium sp. 22-785-1]|uniref:hypothetical protein n=1 Tax=uncultured Agrobacterium sp. TaxID=157277 RepID=UPI0025F7DEA7|nr:hypothetical protein [uncultured Agrobacterium sp.]